MENREIVLDIPVEHERNIFGGLDLFLKKIERSLQVDVIARDGKVKILGSDSQTKKAERECCRNFWNYLKEVARSRSRMWIILSL